MVLCAIILARKLSPEDFAAYSYFHLTVAMLATYAALGLGVTASRFFAEIGCKDLDQVPPIGTLLTLALAAVLLSLIGVLALPGHWLNAGLAIPKWMMAAGVSLTVAAVVPGGGILGLEKYREASIVSLVSAVCMLALAGIAANRQDVVIGMWGILIGLSVQVFGQMAIIVRTTGPAVIISSCRWKGMELRKIIGFAGPMFLVSIIAASGAWIVGRLVLAEGGERQFAIYAIGLQWLALGLLIPGMVSRVVLPRLIRDRSGSPKKLVRTALVLAFIPAIFLVLAGLPLDSFIIRLYGEQYIEFALIIPAFLVVAAINSPINTLGNAIVAHDGQLRWLWISAVSFFVLIFVITYAPSASVFWAVMAHLIATSLMLIQVAVHAVKKGLL